MTPDELKQTGHAEAAALLQEIVQYSRESSARPSWDDVAYWAERSRAILRKIKGRPELEAYPT